MNALFQFTAKCPYCQIEEKWLFCPDTIENHLVKCHNCHQMYVIQIKLIPTVVNVYTLTPILQKENKEVD